MARTKFTELARLSNSFRSRNLGKSRLGDCLDAADRQGEGVFASTSGVEDEEFRVRVHVAFPFTDPCLI